ncbi:ARID DNA-binding domain-containing protein [Tanacetum coccineum]
MVLCFKCQEYGHFANKCTSKKQWEPKVSHKYPEFIYFKTRGIIKGIDKGTWDDFWYVSTTTDKHLTPNLNFFSNFKEEFLVEKLEGQRKLVFTYGMGEVLIKDGSNGYLIPGVHYAPEITLNILSINLLKQQGFEIIFEGDKCTLEYMFKNQQGQNMDVDKMRQRHNDYLDDYFESLDKEKTDKEKEMPRFVEDTDTSKVHTFYEFVAFLNLIKNDDIISKGWDIYRERFDKEEEDCKEQQSAYYGKDQSQVICYRCQSSGHYAFECPNKNIKKDQVKYSSYKEASTSKVSDKGDSHSTSSDDYIVIT